MPGSSHDVSTVSTVWHDYSLLAAAMDAAAVDLSGRNTNATAVAKDARPCNRRSASGIIQCFIGPDGAPILKLVDPLEEMLESPGPDGVSERWCRIAINALYFYAWRRDHWVDSAVSRFQRPGRTLCRQPAPRRRRCGRLKTQIRCGQQASFLGMPTRKQSSGTTIRRI